MSATSNKFINILSFLLVALFSLPLAAEESVDRFLDLNQYEKALKRIDKATEATLTEELAAYMQHHSVSPQTALSRLGEEKFREWSEKYVFGAEVSQADASEATATENPTKFKFQIDPLKEKARLKIEGLLYGQIEVSPSQQLVSLDLFENSDSQMKLQYQHLSTPLGKKDQLQFRWHF